MVPTRTLSQSTTTILKPTHLTTEPRRSQHIRQPSIHKLESDEYEAESQASTRLFSPSKSTPKSKSKSKKRWRGKRGDRPGCIVQPDTNAWPESHEGSPQPFAMAGPNYGDSHLASPGPASNPLEAIDRGEALRCATAVLGNSASRLSTKTLKKVLAAVEDIREESASGPMEIEEGGASALAQSPRRVVLGSRYQPPTGGVADGADYPQGPDKRSATHNSRAPAQPHLEAANDTSTESEPESEIIELGPGDSVSQCLPLVPHTPSTHSQNPHPTPTPHTLNHTNEAKPANDTRIDFVAAAVGESDTQNSDTASNTDTESESEDELETARGYKRQRLVLSPRQPPPPPHPQSSVTHTQHPYLRLAANLPATRIAASSSQTKSSTTLSSLPSSLASSGPPLMSDPNAVLKWAARLAKCSTADQGAGILHHVTLAGPPANNYQLLATVLDNLQHSWLASGKPLGFQNPTEHPSDSWCAEPVENDTAVLEAEAALALGKHVHQCRRATLSDFPGFPCHIATLAIPEVVATAITQGAYEEHEVASNMANKCFATTWKRELPDIRLQRPPPRLTGLIVHRISWFRGKTTERVRPAIVTEYDFINPPRTPHDIRHNKWLARRLLPNTFHCKGLKADVGQYEHSALPHAIAAAYFWAPDSVGAVYHDKFYPLLLPAIAMALTVMQHCIIEWKTRRWMKTSLNIGTQLKMYQCHLKGLLEYSKPAGHRLSEFQKDWFWYRIDYAGADPDEDDEPYQAITRADRVRADTPVPNDNAESHSHSANDKTHGPSAAADVRHLSLAKGKG